MRLDHQTKRTGCTQHRSRVDHFPCQLHHNASDKLKFHTQFPDTACKSGSCILNNLENRRESTTIADSIFGFIEDIYFFEVNTKYISSSAVKKSVFLMQMQ